MSLALVLGQRMEHVTQLRNAPLETALLLDRVPNPLGSAVCVSHIIFGFVVYIP